MTSGILLACIAPVPAAAVSATQKASSIQKGLDYLSNTQQTSGTWSTAGYEHAAAGAAVFALLSQRDKWGSRASRYEAVVDKAMAYLLRTASTNNVSIRDDGANICPDNTSSCKGVHWYELGSRVDATGFIAPAVAAYGLRADPRTVASTSGPLAGMTWTRIAQAITNEYAARQGTELDQHRDGAWHALPGGSESDSTITRWAVLSLLFDETLGAVTPKLVRDELKIWLNNVQTASGAACAQPGVQPCGYAETGSWVLAMRFAGYDPGYPPISAALNFLNTYWQTTINSSHSHVNFGDLNAMWSVFTGLETTIGLNDTMHITNLLSECGTGMSTCAWADDYNEWLVNNQNADGSWTASAGWPPPVAAFVIPILGGTLIPLSSPIETSRSLRRISPPRNLTATVGAPATNTLVGRRPSHFAHRGVTALAETPDGTVVASASTDNRIRVWNANSGEQNLALQGLARVSTGLAFSPRGRVLGSVGTDSILRLWDTASGTQLATLRGHEAAIRAIAASPDGRFLATAGEETRVMLWDIASRTLRKVFSGPTASLNSVVFSPDSRLLAAAGEDARVFIFDVASGKTVGALAGNSGAINAVAFNRDGTVLASGGQDGVIRLWDPATGAQRQSLAGHSAPIRSITFNADGTLMASGGEDTKIILWNTADGSINRTLTGTTGSINALTFNPKGVFLTAASEAGDITFWNVISGAKTLTIQVP